MPLPNLWWFMFYQFLLVLLVHLQIEDALQM
jgi:hypothetical protein